MNKKNIIVVSTAISALLIGAVSFAVSKKSINKLSAANGKYTMTLNADNGPELSGSPSSGYFTVDTAAGNPIQFMYDSLTGGSGFLGMFDNQSKLSNHTAITGMVSVTATFTGALHISYGLASNEAHQATLTSGDELEFPLTACYFELFAPSAANLSSLTIKYDCSMSEQAIEGKAIEEKRVELLGQLDYPREEYRSDEIAAIDSAAQTVRAQIMDENATLADLEAISFAPIENALASAWTNAALMVEEAYEFRHPSEWSLVNDHASNYVETQSTFATAGLGGDDVGYLTSPVLYAGGFEAVIKCDNTAAVAKDFGIIIGNDSAAGDGLDGYMIAWNYDVDGYVDTTSQDTLNATTDHVYLQVFKLLNGYASYGAASFDYIGGWIYNRGSMDLRNDDIRVMYDGEYIRLMNNDDYLNGITDQVIVVNLNVNGYSLAPNSTYRFTYANWDGSSANSLQIKKLIMDTTVSSQDAACQIADENIARYDSTLYESEEQAIFSAKIDEIEALCPNGAYSAIMVRVREFIELLNTLKTHEQKEIERHQDISVQILDNIYSGDPTKYTASNWDAVNDHGLGWSHVVGTHVVTTDGLDGYVMDAAVHTNYTFVFKATNVHASNPYNASWPGAAIIIGGTVDSTTGNYFKGIYLSLSVTYGLQLYDAMAGANQDLGCYGDQFRGGVGSVNAEGLTVRVTVNNGSVTMYQVDPATGNETRLSGDSQSFTQTDTWNINVPAGHFGILDWDLTATTYEILEFKDL